MRRNVSFYRRFFRFGVWRSLVSAVVNVALGACIVPSAGQSLVMQEPDFDGMFTVDYVPQAPVMRDLARGWTYFVGPGNADGVVFSQRLFRVSDAGIPDGQWRLPSDFKITDQYLAPDGAPIVRAAVLNGPVYESRWYRLRPESIGQITPAEISSMAELPPRDAIRLDLPSFGTFRLRQGDGTSIAIEVIVGQPPAYTPIKFLRKRNASGDELWSHVIGGTPRNLATDARGNVYVLGESVSISGTTANLSRIRSDGRVDTTWSPNFNTASNVESTVRVMNDRIVVADVIRGSPSVNRLTTFDLVTGAKVVERYPQYVLGGIAEDGSTLSAHADGRWSVLDTRRNDEADDRISTARVGSPPLPRTSVRWRDGYVIGGNFVYWFDGQLYRNLMRVNASFRPDPTWTPSIDGAVAALAVDGQGRLIVGSNSASGQQAKLARFSSVGALDAGWHPVITGDVYKIYPSSDGMIFIGGAFSAIDGVQRQSLARFSADGLLDRDWASQPSWPRMEAVRWQQSGRDGTYQILDAGTDGV